MNNTGVAFLDFWQTLRRRKVLLLTATLWGAGLALAVNQNLPVSYTSEALLEIEANSPLTRDLYPATVPTTVEQVGTEIDIINSPALADEVVHQLGLASNPAFEAAQPRHAWLHWIATGVVKAGDHLQDVFGPKSKVDQLDYTIHRFQRRLNVVQNRRRPSNVVAVRFQSGSADLSASIVNRLVTDYLAQQVKANQAVSEQENQWLTQHLTELQKAVDEAAQRAQAFRDANGLVDIQAGALPAVQLNEREQALSNARQELAKAEAAYETAVAAQSSGGFVGQEALNSLLIQRLQERQAEISQRLANLQERGGAKSPYLRPVERELDSIREQIAAETAKVVASLHRDLDVARDRVNALQAAVSNSKSEARQNVAAAAMLALLNQEVEAKRHIYTAFLTRMEQTQLASTKFPTVRVVSPARPPARPDGVPPWIAAGLGALGALFMAISGILIRCKLHPHISSAKDLELLTGAAPIGFMPALPGPRETPIAMRILDMTRSGTVETLHTLRFMIQSMNPGTQCTQTLVTSAMPEEGKTTLATSLARLSAASGLRVLLVEADLRRPTMGRVFRFSSNGSLEAVLQGKSRLADAVHIDQKSGLHCLVAEGSGSNPVCLLESQAFDALMAEARRQYDMVIIDSPPVVHAVDALILSKYADAILFAVACGVTNASAVAEALSRFPVEVLSRIATVLTRVPQSDEAWSISYSGYRRKLLIPPWRDRGRQGAAAPGYPAHT